MSTERNIQSAQAGCAALGRGDLQGVLPQLDESIEWIAPEVAGMPGSGGRRGHSGVLQPFQAVKDCWRFEAFEPREYIASGDTVAVVGYYRAQSVKTGRVAESGWGMVWHSRDGKCVRFQEFTDAAAMSKALVGMAAGPRLASSAGARPRRRARGCPGSRSGDSPVGISRQGPSFLGEMGT